MLEEKRQFTRIPFRVKVKMVVDHVRYEADQMDNLSVGGCLIPLQTDLEAGSVCRLKILMSGTDTQLSVQVDGEIIRCTQGTVAVKFTHIDPDSLSHLQNIIRYNAPDPEAVERELVNHPTLKG